MAQGVRRPDGLDPRGRAARRLRGKPKSVSLSIHDEVLTQFRSFAKRSGMTHNTALKFLLDNRPETTFVLPPEELDDD